MKPLNGAALGFSAKTYLAAMLAVYVAFRLDLPRPFWAMMTAYITSQPFSGAVRSKAVYRVCGTLAGGIAALLMVPVLVDAPELLTLALGLWVAGCLAVSLLDRTPRAYGFMLSGYTAALVGFPAVLAPDQIFQTAVARAEEISLGAICASLVHGLIFPVDLLPKIGADLRRMLADAERWIADTLAQTPATAERDRRRLAADSTDLYLATTHLPFDPEASPESRQALLAVQDRFVSLLPLLTALADRLRALDHVPPALNDLLQATKNWTETAGTPDAAAALIRTARAQEAAVRGRDWQALLTTNLYQRLIDVIETLQACRDLAAAVTNPRRFPAHLTPLLISAKGRTLHRDPMLALRSGFAVLVVVAATASFWIISGWPDGATATMIAATFTCLFATQDDPRPALRSMALYVALALPVTAFYSFAVLPAIDGFVLMALSLAPVLLAIGYFMARPATNGRAMGFMMGFVGALALQSAYNADFAAFMNGNVAQLVGAFAAVVAIALCRVVGTVAAARRLVRASARDLARLADAGARLGLGVRPHLDTHAWASRTLDREGLLVQRMAGIVPDPLLPDPLLANADLLNDLRVGANILTVQRVRRCLGDEGTLAGLFAQLGSHFRAVARGRGSRNPALLAQLDQSLALFAADAASPDHRDGIAALVGLRRNLFPDAPGYQVLGYQAS